MKKILLLLLLLLTLMPFTSLHAYTASDLIGQLDGSDSPVYTTERTNNAPNSRGLAFVLGIVIDTVHHHLFVADTANNRVLVYNLNSSNQLLDRIADNVLGQPNMYTSTASSTQSIMHQTIGIDIDIANSRLFVSDSLNNRVLVYDISSVTDGMNASFVLGQSNFTANSLAVTQSGMDFPADVTYDSSTGFLYVSDYNNNRVLVFDLSSGITNGQNATFVLGQSSFTAKVIATTQTGMNNPHASIIDSANHRLFVSDINNNRVLIFDVSALSNGMAASNVLGQADFTHGSTALTQTGLNGPVGMVYDSAHNRLFLTDHYNNRILIFDSTIITDGEAAVNVLGQADFTHGSTALTQNGLSGPEDLAYDSSNQLLYVPENGNHRIMIYDVTAITDGENAVNLLGQLDKDDTPVYTKGAVQNYPNAQGLSFNLGGALDTANHRVFVGDYANNRVLVFNLDSNNILVDHTADYVIGQPNIYTTTAGITASKIDQPIGVALNAAGTRLFVADYGNHRVLMFNVTPDIIADGESAMNVIGQPNFTTKVGATTQAGLKNPVGIALDETNNILFIADNTNNRVMVYDASSITDGMSATHVLGQTLFTTATPATTQSGLSAPYTPYYDSDSQRLFVPDFSNNRLMIFDVSSITDGMSATHVLGQTLFTTATAATTQIGMSGTDGVTFDPETNRLFVTEYYNNRVLVFDLSSISNGQPAIGVIGQPDFTSSGNTATQSGLKNPAQTYYDQTNKVLYVTDSQHHRVMLFKFIKITGLAVANGRVEDGYNRSIVDEDNSQGTVTYAISSGSLPSGLILSSSGTLSGTPSSGTEGSYSFAIQGVDSNGVNGDFSSNIANFNLTINSRSNSSGYSRATTTPTPQVVCKQGDNFSPTTGLPCTSHQIIPVTTCSITNTLRLHSRGDEVKCLQKNLNISTDGIFGPQTKAAVIVFQNNKSLIPDGIVGPKTRLAMTRN